MTEKEERLDRLLDYIEGKIDLAHCLEVDNRYKNALKYQPVDMPPLVIKCEENPAGLKPYPYIEAFDDPAKMMFNQLLNRVCPGLEFKDDSPLAIRTDHGTIIIASILGGKWLLKDDNYPWVEPAVNIAEIEAILDRGPADLDAGLNSRVVEFIQFYRDKLSDYPRCNKALQIALPDLQGPFDTTHQLCGSNIYYELCDRPELIKKLLTLITETMISYASRIRPLTVDRLRPNLICQHGYMIPGEILIRDDSAINLSSRMYSGIMYPYDEQVLNELGGGSIHFCGNGEHQIETMLKIKNLRGFDIGQPQLMDVHRIYRKCVPEKISITGLQPPAEDLISGKAWNDFPTGVVFVYEARTIAEAHEVITGYRSKHHDGR